MGSYTSTFGCIRVYVCETMLGTERITCVMVYNKVTGKSLPSMEISKRPTSMILVKSKLILLVNNHTISIPISTLL